MSKTRKILLCILSALFVIVSAFGFASVWAKYVAEKGGTGSIGGDDGYDLPYEIASPVVVNTQEQLFEALQYGYSYIQLGENLKNPFIVTEDVTTMSRSLILDLNGKEIQRNSRDPMLKIPSGVTLTLIDTSLGKKGGLYNPVGSVLQIEGGTLSVTAGKFESGPRPSEYVSGEGGSRIDDSKTISVSVSRRDGGKIDQEMPVFRPDVVDSYVYGNVYFDEAWGEGVIPADTYCYFVTSDGFTAGDTVEFEKTSADFSYSYYAYPATAGTNAYQYRSVSTPAGTVNEDYVVVTVYGYTKDIETAQSKSGDAQYAAVKMLSGELNINVNSTSNSGAGSFWSYFGVEQAACVYFSGGTMNVNTTGTFSTVDPAEIQDINPAGLAAGGEGICILSGSNNTGNLYITNGTYLSYLNDTIHMTGGDICVTGGQFYKDASASAEDTDLSNGAAIYLSGKDSKIMVTGSSGSTIPFYMKGSGLVGIYSEDGATLEAEYTKFVVQENDKGYGKNNIGIYNVYGTVTVSNSEFDLDSNSSGGIVSNKVVGDTSSHTAKVTVSSTLFSLNGEDSKGIYQQYGDVVVNSGIFSMTGKAAVGILASEGRVDVGTEATSTSYKFDDTVIFYIDHIEDCYGIKVGINDGENNSVGTTDENAIVTVNLYSVQFFIGQGTDGEESYYKTENTTKPSTDSGINCAGIFTNLNNATVNVGRGVFLVAGSYSAGIYAQQGKIETLGNTDAAHKLAIFAGVKYSSYTNGGQSASGWIYSPLTEDGYKQGASFSDLVSTPATGSYGIASLGGVIDLGSVYVHLRSVSAAGLYSRGGNVTLQDFQADIEDENGVVNTNQYLTTSTISVESGNVKISNGAVKTTGIGVTVEGGNLTIDGTFSITATRTTAIFTSGGSIELGTESVISVNSTIEALADGVTALPWQAGTGLAYHYDGIKVMGGSLAANGTLNVTHTGLGNDTDYDSIYNFVVKSFAIRVTASETASVVIRKGTIQTTVGGGVYVNGGDLTLGTSGMASSELTVSTTGTGLDTQKLYRDSDFLGNQNWSYYKSITGGHAISVAGGSLTVYGGTYSAEQGDGIIVKDGIVRIYDGVFQGKDSYSGVYVGAGPGASYCLAMFGGELTIENGTFDGTLCVLTRGRGADSKVTATIKKGSFKSATDSAAFCVYDYSDITLGTVGGSNDDLELIGGSSALTIEGLTNVNGTVSVTINSGIYQCTRNSNSRWTNAVYYAYQPASFTINGGYFDGSTSYGIYFNLSEVSNVKVNGGTFLAKSYTFYINDGNALLSTIVDTTSSKLLDGDNATIAVDDNSTINGVGANTYIQVDAN